MSERMIELQRARLLAAGKGNATPAQPSPNGSQGAGSTSAGTPAAAAQRPTPQQAALVYVQSEDLRMQTFLQRLQNRDDMRTDSTSAPTVPTSLSRRILHRQGVGYIDNTIGAIASAAADRFLATVLHQAVACRDQRLKGVAMEKEAARQLKRHLESYRADSDDRKRRKAQHEGQREKANLAAIEAAEALKRPGTTTTPAGADAENDDSAKSKKKKPLQGDTTLNGNKRRGLTDDDGASYDSIDEEEEYYQEYYGDGIPDVDDEEEEENDSLILRDIARPLEAWDFHMTGKQGMVRHAPEDQDEEVEEWDGQDEDVEGMQSGEKLGQSDDASSDAPEASNDKKSPEKASRASATSPAPPPSNPSRTAA